MRNSLVKRIMDLLCSVASINFDLFLLENKQEEDESSVCFCLFSKKRIDCAVSELDTMSEGSGKKPRQGITSDIITELTECNARLSGQRKKRQICFQFLFIVVS